VIDLDQEEVSLPAGFITVFSEEMLRQAKSWAQCKRFGL